MAFAGSAAASRFNALTTFLIAGAAVAVTGSMPAPKATLQNVAGQPQVQQVAHAAAPVATAVAIAAANMVSQAAPQAQEPAPQTQPVIAFTESANPAIKFNDQRYYDQVRSRLHWVEVKVGGSMLRTPDEASRLLLSEAAARKAHLEQVGLNFRDVYGIINAETSWIPRMGSSKDGTPNLGIAQFEPATARALGLRNPNDPVESVHVMALHLKDAAIWSANRIANLKLSDAQRALKLREGISIYYNLSTKGRAMWNGLNTARLPIETQRHIHNARLGAQEADQLARELGNVRTLTQGAGVFTASN